MTHPALSRLKVFADLPAIMKVSQKTRNAVVTCLIIGGIGLIAYLHFRRETHTLNFGPVAAKIVNDEKADQMGDETLQKEEHLKKFVSDLAAPVCRDLGLGRPYNEAYHFKKKDQYFRIMGSAPRGSRETVIFVIVLHEGKQVFIEVGNLYSSERYPDGVF
jgi:hypothetical protein